LILFYLYIAKALLIMHNGGVFCCKNNVSFHGKCKVPCSC
jgi:hypothetical protein